MNPDNFKSYTGVGGRLLSSRNRPYEGGGGRVLRHAQPPWAAVTSVAVGPSGALHAADEVIADGSPAIRPQLIAGTVVPTAL
jgi:hypothetical protein